MPKVLEYEIAPTLAEDQIWTRDIRPELAALPANVLDIWEFAITEMLNNAIDHSGGTKITVEIQQNGGLTEIMISDNGIGIFRKIQAALGLLDERHAILELSKGKLTTDPEKHSGQGIFFTSRVLDEFAILSGGSFFSHASQQKQDWMLELLESEPGTHVQMRLADDAGRTFKDVSDQYSSPEDYGFSKTVVPVRLARYGSEKLVARSQAKRVLARVDLFKSVVFDFEGVDFVGQAFADEMFRVFASSHPDIQLHALNANLAIRLTIGGVAPSPNVHY